MIQTAETQASERIFGGEQFFRFKEYPYADIDQYGDLVQQIRDNELAGFIMTDVFSQQEITDLKAFLDARSDSDFMPTPSGKIFPAPFATISDNGERLEHYYSKLDLLDRYKNDFPAVAVLSQKLDAFFAQVARTHRVSIPYNKTKDRPVAPGTFRLFYPNMGGLHVHCGNFFQAQSMHFYSMIKNDIDMNDQLSYFLVLQHSEVGGELTIYDMLWDNVKRKESAENNEFVIDDEGKAIYVDTMRKFYVKPKPGDILIFAGGPIWHRVEDIKGTAPRITFGGFLNFSKDNKELYYWS